MPGRIITLQRQARELGRLRTGYSVPSEKRNRPVRSETWIVTSHSEEYVRAAAALWGGEPERWQPQGHGAEQWRVTTRTGALDAIMPPGDPLSQSYELWSGGGCKRRCDGMTELLSDSPCICRRQHGEAFHRHAAGGGACKATTRLNLILPDMPDIGVWRVETHSFYAANELATHVDLIRGATDGKIPVPVRVRIEQRTRVVDGKTKQYPVVALEIRGATAMQVLTGRAKLDALEAVAPASRPAIEAGPAVEWSELVAAATTRSELYGLRERAKEAGMNGEVVDRILTARAAELGLIPDQAGVDGEPAPGEVDEAAVDVAEVEPDPDEVWQQIVAAASRFKGMDALEKDLADFLGITSDDANGWQLQKYLEHLKAGAAR